MAGKTTFLPAQEGNQKELWLNQNKTTQQTNHDEPIHGQS